MEPELKRRITTASFLIGGVALFLLAAALTEVGRFALMALGFATTVVCAFEFARICAADPAAKIKAVVYFVCAALPALGQFLFYTLEGSGEPPLEGHKSAALLLLLFFGSGLVGLAFMVSSAKQELALAGESAREFWCGIFLVGLGGGALTAICAGDQGFRAMLWLLLVVCSNDSAAYFAGSKYGRTKLAPAISPNKTVVGTLSGLLAGVLIGVLTSALLPARLSWEAALMLSVAIVLAAQLGDLSKSYLKRLHGVKDSGDWLPGHGGLLDRADAVLMAAPLLYSWLLWQG
ncbi:MAG: phosphatidate cytidylyltransferase [Deltaproteobacteria bacterium]|nr:phosphatidate cytidylyltransferase [Deltaproteobacteria bacterium]